MERIGIIGFGAFGQLAAKYLKKKFKVIVSDEFDKRKQANKIGVEFVGLREACESDVVLLCAPSSAMEKVLKKIKGLLKPGSLVVDVCSVKSFPCQLMTRLLPKNVEIIGSHPLFGPQSAKKGLTGLQIVVCPVRSKRVGAVKKFLEKLGLRVVLMTPEEHDKAMAATQALTHFALKAFAKVLPRKTRVTLTSVEKMREAIGLVEKDSPQLFNDIQTLNPFASKQRLLFVKELKKVESALE